MFAWTTSPLFAQPSQIVYDNTAPGDIYFADGGFNNFVFFDNTAGTGAFGYLNPPNLIFAAVPSTTIATTVPEPSTWAMMILGLAGLGFVAYCRQRPADPTP
jgi:hypothetical protein